MVTVSYRRRGQARKKLILAVGKHADGNGGCPTELAEAFWAEMYNMAGPGCIDDQDMVRLTRWDQLKAYYRACVQFNQNGLKNLSADERRLVLEVADLELANA